MNTEEPINTIPVSLNEPENVMLKRFDEKFVKDYDTIKKMINEQKNLFKKYYESKSKNRYDLDVEELEAITTIETTIKTLEWVLKKE